MDLSMLSGPIIGAIIGYGTNWIAIKMMFRPLKPIKIGKVILPFTPGIIPKRKNKLAEAIGQSVGNSLFTRVDIEKMLLSEESEAVVVKGILENLMTEKSIKNRALEMIEEEEYWQVREGVKLWISEKIKEGLLQAQIGETIAKEGAQIMREKVKGGLLRMFVTDELIDSIAQPIGHEVEQYMKINGEEKIIPIVEQEINSFEQKSMKDLMSDFDVNIEKLEDKIKEIYRSFIRNNVTVFLEKFDIAKTVENKVNQMEVLELEKLLLSIMKKELGAIVNLGALIGLILGTLNILL